MLRQGEITVPVLEGRPRAYAGGVDQGPDHLAALAETVKQRDERLAVRVPFDRHAGDDLEQAGFRKRFDPREPRLERLPAGDAPVDSAARVPPRDGLSGKFQSPALKQKPKSMKNARSFPRSFGRQKMTWRPSQLQSHSSSASAPANSPRFSTSPRPDSGK